MINSRIEKFLNTIATDAQVESAVNKYIDSLDSDVALKTEVENRTVDACSDSLRY